MKFYYVVPAYNEESQLRETFAQIAAARSRYPEIEILFVDNASSDGTWPTMQELAAQNSNWVRAYREERKGLGLAFGRALRELQKQDLTGNDWVVYCAADLPFGFTDLDSLLSQGSNSWEKTVLYVGSKRHPKSQIRRHWKRVLGSAIFEFLRWVILRVRTKDTQGSLFLRGDYVHLVEKMHSEDYFFSVELVYFAEKSGEVVEIPVTYGAEIRPSRLSLFHDGMKTISQLWKFRQRL